MEIHLCDVIQYLLFYCLFIYYFVDPRRLVILEIFNAENRLWVLFLRNINISVSCKFTITKKT